MTLTRLHCFVNEQNKNLIFRITIQEFSSETTRGKYIFRCPFFNLFDMFRLAKSILLPSDYPVTCPIQTSEYLHRLCSNHQSYPLLITFHLINRSSNNSSVQLHLLSTNDNHDETTTNQEKFSNLLMSLSLSLPSIRQKQSFHLSK